MLASTSCVPPHLVNICFWKPNTKPAILQLQRDPRPGQRPGYRVQQVLRTRTRVSVGSTEVSNSCVRKHTVTDQHSQVLLPRCCIYRVETGWSSWAAPSVDFLKDFAFYWPGDHWWSCCYSQDPDHTTGVDISGVDYCS